jgi:anti-anti-sigma factor
MSGKLCNTTVTIELGVGERYALTELVRGDEQRLVERMTPLVRRRCVSLDLSPVERIDAAGIAALITLYTNACQAGHTFAISNASPRVRELLTLVGLDRILLSQDVGTASCPAQQPELTAA